VAQEDLNTFLSVAEELKVKGLTQTETENKSPGQPPSRRGGFSKKSNQESQNKAASSDSQYKKYLQQPHEDTEADIQEIVPVKTEAPGDMVEEQEYDETSGAWYEYGEEGQGVDTSLISTDGGNRDLKALIWSKILRLGGGEYQCQDCGLKKKASGLTALKNHVEARHLTGLAEYHCPYCGKICSTNNYLNVHISQHHKSDQ